MSAPAAPPAGDPAIADAAPKKAKLGKIILLGFIAAVIGGECLFAFMFLSKAGTAEAQADGILDDEHSEAAADESAEGSHEPVDDAHAPADGGHDAAHGKPGGHGNGDGHGKQGGHGKADAKGKDAHGADDAHGGGPAPDELEIDLGEFSLTAFQPASNSTLLINFHLYGTVAFEREAEFNRQYATNMHRLREQVIMTIRSAEISDLTDPGLGLIKRQILEKTNRTLGKALLKGVIFSDFLALDQ